MQDWVTWAPSPFLCIGETAAEALQQLLSHAGSNEGFYPIYACISGGPGHRTKAHDKEQYWHMISLLMISSIHVWYMIYPWVSKITIENSPDGQCILAAFIR